MLIKIYSCFPKREDSQEWEKLILFVASHYKDSSWKAVSYDVNLRNLGLILGNVETFYVDLKGEDLGFS